VADVLNAYRVPPRMIAAMASLLEDLVDIEGGEEEEELTPEGREVFDEALDEIRRRRLLNYVV